jgi:hypothetical protein
MEDWTSCEGSADGSGGCTGGDVVSTGLVGVVGTADAQGGELLEAGAGLVVLVVAPAVGPAGEQVGEGEGEGGCVAAELSRSLVAGSGMVWPDRPL